MKIKTIGTFLKQVFQEWQEDKVMRMGAALSYYTIFAIGPLLIVVITIGSLIWERDLVRGEILGQIGGLIGQEGGSSIEQLIQNASQTDSGILAILVGFVVLVFGASGVFIELQDSLNTIWEVQPKPGTGIRALIKNRFRSFAMILGIGFLLLVSLVVNAALAAIGKFWNDSSPAVVLFLQIVSFIVTPCVIAAFFAMIFKVLPDVKMAWRDVWVGAGITALLFTVGKLGIELYIGRSQISSMYGTAGSFIVILTWIYYSSQIVLFGAECTQVYANRYGSKVTPDKDAVSLTEKSRAEQGIPHYKMLKKKNKKQE